MKQPTNKPTSGVGRPHRALHAQLCFPLMQGGIVEKIARRLNQKMETRGWGGDEEEEQKWEEWGKEEKKERETEEEEEKKTKMRRRRRR